MSTSGLDSVRSFRRPVLYVTIAAFSLAALMGVGALLGGGDFGETEVRILLTTLLVGLASVCVLCYLAAAETPYAVVGAVGGLVTVLPVVTGLTLIWHEFDYPDEEPWFKALGVGCVLAGSFAQASMLMAFAWSVSRLAIPLWGTVLLVGVLGLLLSSMIVGESDDEGLWRLVGVLAILDVLGTLVTAAVARFGGRDEGAPSALRLPPGLDTRLSARAEEVGRSREELLAGIVEEYLAGPAPGAEGTRVSRGSS